MKDLHSRKNTYETKTIFSDKKISEDFSKPQIRDLSEYTI